MAGVESAGEEVTDTSSGSQEIGRGGMNGMTPYFRCYAADWLARLQGTSAATKALVLEAICVGWTETKSGTATRSLDDWAMLCGCKLSEVMLAVTQLEGRQWITASVAGNLLTIHVPDMDKQLELVTKAATEKREQRLKVSRGLSKGHIARELASEEGARERQSRTGSLSGPSAPAPEAVKHSILAEAIGRMPR